LIANDLIFDVGMHQGEDSEFYLKKGFRVVAVEALEAFCTGVSERLADSIAAGRLIIVNKAIAEKPGPVAFYANESLSVWGTLNPAWARRNERLGAPSRKVTVEGVRLEELLEQFGVPYYLKVDIEGADLLCLRALRESGARPNYVSIESTKSSWAGLVDEFDLMVEMGYSRFKIVNQNQVPAQVPPSPAREGKTIDHKFGGGASGLFGEEAPGAWLSRQEALAEYRRIFRRYRFFGDDGLLRRTRVTRRLMRLCGIQEEWYDTHAAR
jgi:FkbM family methyltransferase